MVVELPIIGSSLSIMHHNLLGFVAGCCLHHFVASYSFICVYSVATYALPSAPNYPSLQANTSTSAPERDYTTFARACQRCHTGPSKRLGHLHRPLKRIKSLATMAGLPNGFKVEEDVKIKSELDTESPGAFIDEDDDDTGELTIPKEASTGGWMTRVPQELWEGMNSLTDGDEIQLGAIKVWSDGNGHPRKVGLNPMPCTIFNCPLTLEALVSLRTEQNASKVGYQEI